MKIRIFLFILTFYGIQTGSVYCQGRILMLNGKEKRFSIAEVKGDVIVFQPEGTKKPVSRKLDKFDVFSIVRDNGVEEIVYNPDTVTSDDPTISEARDYIRGERYAAILYRKPMNLISGIAVGGAGSFIGFYGLIVPVIYPAIIGRFTPKIPPTLNNFSYDESSGQLKPVENPESLEVPSVSEAFSAGYGKKARNMKIKNSLIGGGIGFAVGLTAFIILLGNN